MAITLSNNLYSFDAATRKITFADSVSIKIQNILLITNLVTNVFIYQFNGGSTLGGTLSGQVLTLTYDTTAMSNTNELQIRVEFLPETVQSPQVDSLQLILRELKRTNLILASFTNIEIKDKDIGD